MIDGTAICPSLWRKRFRKWSSFHTTRHRRLNSGCRRMERQRITGTHETGTTAHSMHATRAAVRGAHHSHTSRECFGHVGGHPPRRARRMKGKVGGYERSTHDISQSRHRRMVSIAEESRRLAAVAWLCSTELEPPSCVDWARHPLRPLAQRYLEDALVPRPFGAA